MLLSANLRVTRAEAIIAGHIPETTLSQLVSTYPDEVLVDCGIRKGVEALNLAIIRSGGSCEEQKQLEYIAWHESTGGRDLVNKTSSARGAYQFMFNTWNERCTGNRMDFVDSTACALRLIRNGETYDQWLRWWE